MGGIKHSIVNIVNNIVITMHGARWVLEILGGIRFKVYDLQIRECSPLYDLGTHSHMRTGMRRQGFQKA